MNDISFSCGIVKCIYATNVQQDFENHNRNHHKNEAVLLCRKCGHVFTCIQELILHIKNDCSQVMDIVLQCGARTCDHTTADPFEFVKHLKTVHRDLTLLSCFRCNRLFTFPVMLVQHIQTSCVMLPAVPPRKAKRGRPATRNASQNFDSRKRKSTQDNQGTRKRLRVAEKSLGHKVSLSRKCKEKTALQRKPAIRIRKTVEREPVEFNCSKCEYRTNVERDFKVHYGIHGRDIAYFCRKCGHAHESLDSLIVHFKTDCSKVKDIILPCGIGLCNYTSTDPFEFMDHLKYIHRGTSLLPCFRCNKIFTYPFMLIQHMQVGCSERIRPANERGRGNVEPTKTPRRVSARNLGRNPGADSPLTKNAGRMLRSRMSLANGDESSSGRGRRGAVTRNAARNCNGVSETSRNANSKKSPAATKETGRRPKATKRKSSPKTKGKVVKCSKKKAKTAKNDTDKEELAKDIEFCCGKCCFSTYSEQDFEKHYKSHRNEVVHFCRKCGHVFASVEDLICHIKTDCSEIKDIVLQCGIGSCVYTSPDPFDFADHTKYIHRDRTLLPCFRCNKCFTFPVMLIQHMQVGCAEKLEHPNHGRLGRQNV